MEVTLEERRRGWFSLQQNINWFWSQILGDCEQAIDTNTKKRTWIPRGPEFEHLENAKRIEIKLKSHWNRTEIDSKSDWTASSSPASGNWHCPVWAPCSCSAFWEEAPLLRSFALVAKAARTSLALPVLSVFPLRPAARPSLRPSRRHRLPADSAPIWPTKCCPHA